MAAAAVVLGFATPAPVSAAQTENGSSASGGRLTLTPASAAAWESVTVRAACAAGSGHGKVSSPAFRNPATLRPGPGGAAVADAVVRPGLLAGERYAVTADCRGAEPLTAWFVHTGGGGAGTAPAVGLPSDVTESQTGGLAQQEDDGPGVGRAALAIGGGLATAGLAGYVLTLRGRPARPSGSGPHGSRLPCRARRPHLAPRPHLAHPSVRSLRAVRAPRALWADGRTTVSSGASVSSGAGSPAGRGRG
ncbi:hypothetical protein LHJ74_05825 [Streptomyces sp. N2-109]|uniref:Uncharacterized protein n=1 Tax=Streptomyces gossypii TaxID=2883101 RepID=A0ABT2JNJ2_9ACTN|nr:hypothetical protein [Streptomyces gossypii]MCT2589452.1 hypothetical protein [Streptomyces gossypii]